jgi:hypothetical protein
LTSSVKIPPNATFGKILSLPLQITGKGAWNRRHGKTTQIKPAK